MERFTDGQSEPEPRKEKKVDRNKAILNYIMNSLRATRPWTRLLSVLGFIMVVFTILIGIAMIVGRNYLPISDKAPPLALTIMGVFYILSSVFYLVPSIWLSKYSSAITRFLGEADAIELGNAIAYHKSFWKFLGITVLVSIIIAVIGIIAAIFIPTLLSFRG